MTKGNWRAIERQFSEVDFTPVIVCSESVSIVFANESVYFVLSWSVCILICFKNELTFFILFDAFLSFPQPLDVKDIELTRRSCEEAENNKL